ncbi:MAG: carbohydrate ABC transporter permease [Chloroflexota bacterium]
MPTAAPTKKRQWAPSRLRRRPQTGASAQAFAAYVFSSGYVLLLLVFGVLPMVYALYLSFTKSGRFVGLDNYVKAVGDFRFLPAVQHVAAFLVIWVVTLTVLVTVLALIVHAVRVRWLSSTTRFLFFIPGAFAGAASVMLWLFLLNPSVSPVSFVLKWFGYTNFVQAIDLNNLPLIFTVVAFWTGAGAWIIIMYAALHNISNEIMEAARCDGASAIKTAWYIQLPLIRKWIAYMVVISVAVGTQLFAEPKILAQASRNQIPKHYSLNQLAYVTAFGPQADFNSSAAISMMLLVVAAGLAAFFVFRGGLFDRD